MLAGHWPAGWRAAGAGASRKDSVVLGMVLEPARAGPDHRAGRGHRRDRALQRPRGPDQDQRRRHGHAAAGRELGSDPDGKSYTFKLKQAASSSRTASRSTAAAVKFSFERAKAEGSTNKAKKAVFDNISSDRHADAHTVILVLNNADGHAALPPGREHGRDPEPEERGHHRHQAGGHRPLQAGELAKGQRGHAGEVGRATATPRQSSSRRPPSASSTTRPPRWPRCWPATSTACRASPLQACAVPGRQALHGEIGTPRARASWPSTTSASRWTTCGCAAPSCTPSTARPSSTARSKGWASPSAATSRPPTPATST
jgi:hypothetical protein